MQSGDRIEFDAQMSLLCAGFNVPIGDRAEAYWKGMAKMSIVEFARCVEFALGENGPEKIPTTGQLWNLRKKLKADVRLPALSGRARDRSKLRDNLVFFANRLMLRHVMSRAGLGSTSDFVPGHGVTNCMASDELKRALKFKSEIVSEFASYIREGDDLATKREFVRQFFIGMDRVSPIANRPMWEKLANDTRGEQQFPAYMAEGISTSGTFDFGDDVGS